MEKNTPQLSIVVTIYNGAHTLMKCLNSLYAQTLKNYEIICVDDGSTDASLALLKQEAMKNQKVKVIHQSNQGVWFARKAGIREAAGKWIGFVDCDDTVEDCMYQEMVSLGEQEEDIDMVVCGFQKVDAKTDETYARQMTGFGAQVRDVKVCGRGFLSVVNPSMCNKIFRLECTQKAIELVKAPRIMEDFIFVASILPLFRKVAFTGNAFYRYYDWNNSATKRIGHEDMIQAKEALECLEEFWHSKYKDHALLDLLVLLHLGIAFTINYNQEDGKKLKSIWKETIDFLDVNFPMWRRNKYLTVRCCVRDQQMWKLFFAGHIYQTPAYPMAVRLYQNLSKRLNIDMKW